MLHIVFSRFCVPLPSPLRNAPTQHLRCRRFDRISKSTNANTFSDQVSFTNGTETERGQAIARFISALDGDADLKGKISYRCMKVRDDAAHYHLAAAPMIRPSSSFSCETISNATPKRQSTSPAETLWFLPSRSSRRPITRTHGRQVR